MRLDSTSKTVGYKALCLVAIFSFASCESLSDQQDQQEQLETQEEGKESSSQDTADEELAQESDVGSDLPSDFVDANLANPAEVQDPITDFSAEQLVQNLNDQAPDVGSQYQATSPGAAPSPSGAVVHYATSRATVYNQPGGAGSEVARLEQGDSVLVVVQGEWAEIPGRGYVTASSLSSSPVGREKYKLGWNQ